MTLDEVRHRLDKIQAHMDSGEDEAAHAEEDDLYEAVVRSIAELTNKDGAVSLCRCVLQSKIMNFSRHCS